MAEPIPLPVALNEASLLGRFQIGANAQQNIDQLQAEAADEAEALHLYIEHIRTGFDLIVDNQAIGIGRGVLHLEGSQARLSESEKHLQVFTRDTLRHFGGAVVAVSADDQSQHPITEYEWQSGAFVQSKYVARDYHPYPSRVRGTISDISLAEGTLKLRPKGFSPRRFLNKAFFDVRVLDETQESLVSIEFLAA